MKIMRLLRAAGSAAFFAFLFCSLAVAQNVPTAGFRAKIEADWERQEATRDRSVADVDSLRDLIARSNELIERLAGDKLVENSKLDVFRAAVASAENFLENAPSRDESTAIADAYRALRWASRDAIFANELLKDSPVVFEKANRFGFQILQEYLSFYER